MVWQELLAERAHRPYPLPEREFSMTMSWLDLLFAHWPVHRGRLRGLVPEGLELDLWDGQAWVGVVPFRMTRVGPPRLNRVPWVSAFEELNVRTYVRHRGIRGVYFFSLDAACWPAVVGARLGFRLPYYWAQISQRSDGSSIHYESRRLLGRRARLDVRYRPAGEVFRAAPGSFEHWLTERYALYTTDSSGRIYRGDVHHLPWPLQVAEAELVTNEMTQWKGLALLGRQPVLHFARRLDVLAWPLIEPGA
jgi:uncharacterized protein